MGTEKTDRSAASFIAEKICREWFERKIWPLKWVKNEPLKVTTTTVLKNLSLLKKIYSWERQRFGTEILLYLSELQLPRSAVKVVGSGEHWRGTLLRSRSTCFCHRLIHHIIIDIFTGKQTLELSIVQIWNTDWKSDNITSRVVSFHSTCSEAPLFSKIKFTLATFSRK